ncbi:MAG: nucleotide exchange factor GrpE [Clostridiales bacterium]|jgi:molecular chaperone GrpE|nr:nucleotide exchange factor GrpE [Clostridiales bacterium]
MKHKPDKVNNAETREAVPEPNAEPEINAEPENGEIAAEEEAPAGWESVANEKEKQALELLDRLQRTMAEFDNFRKRTIKEKASIYDDGVKDTIEKLLPVVDNFERALAAAEDKENSLYKGIEMTFRQLSEILKRMGVEPVPGAGEPFDPNFHHAVAHTDDESLGENVVAEELQKGYKYKDKVLRPSMVKVAN